MKANREDYVLTLLGILVAVLVLWWRSSHSAIVFWAQIVAFIAFMVIAGRSGRPISLYRFQRVTARHLALLIVGTISVLLFAWKMRDVYSSALSEAVSAVE